MRVLAIDPGKVTGVCLYDTDEPTKRKLFNVEGGVVGMYEFSWTSNWQRLVYHKMVVERFTLREGVHGVDLDPVEIIGWLKGTVGDEIVWQSPAEAKQLITNEKLKQAGLYPPRGEVGPGHAVDALRHALTYLVKQRHLETIKLLSPKDDNA